MYRCSKAVTFLVGVMGNIVSWNSGWRSQYVLQAFGRGMDER